MKLLKCYVASFGKLQDYTCSFSQGLNTIKEENGWGKSTLATFIKAIFYGLNDSKRNVSDNERMKYKPWNSTERFGGYVEFEWGGKEFKIERFFGNKESEDTLKLYDLKTGKVHDNPQDIGKRIFEIDEEGFLSTTYYSQKDFQIKSNTSLTAKYNSVCEVQETVSFDKALSRLEEKAKTYKYRGDKGLISDTKRQIFQINENIEQANKSQMTLITLKNGYDAIDRETKEIKTKLDGVIEREKVAGKAEANGIKKSRHDKLNNEINLLKAEKEKADKILNGNLTSAGEIDAYLKCNSDLENIKIRENDLSSDIKQLEGSIVPKKKSVAPLTFVTVGCVSFLLAVVFALALGIASVLAITSIVICILFFVLTGVSSYLGNKTGEDANSQYQGIIQKKKGELLEYGKIKAEYVNKIDEYFNRFNLEKTSDRQSILLSLKEIVVKHGETVKMLGALMAELSELEKDKSFLNQGASASESLLELHATHARLQEQYDYNTRELAKKQASIRYYEDIVSTLPELEGKKLELAEKLATYKTEYDLINLTVDYLKKADETLKVKYREPLQNSLNRYLKLVTGEESTAKIDIDLNVTVEEKGAAKVTDFYSKGYQNLFEICKRFALTDVLFKGEKPFIILDDPFYNLDDQKLNLALELIKKLSDEYQIVYFVCHESRKA